MIIAFSFAAKNERLRTWLTIAKKKKDLNPRRTAPLTVSMTAGQKISVFGPFFHEEGKRF